MTGEDRILMLYQRGEQGAGWYDKTRKNLRELFGADTDTFIGMLAATSANASVNVNVTLALKAFEQYKKGLPFGGFLPLVIENLERIAAGNFQLRGDKIHNFCHALLGVERAVVVDRWMYRAYDSRDRDAIKCRLLQDCNKVDETPRRFQAGVWFGIRGGDIAPFETIVRRKLGLHQLSLRLY